MDIHLDISCFLSTASKKKKAEHLVSPEPHFSLFCEVLQKYFERNLMKCITAD
jgi:hypothetical protein